MTFEERMDRIAERHEALERTVENLAVEIGKQFAQNEQLLAKVILEAQEPRRTTADMFNEMKQQFAEQFAEVKVEFREVAARFRDTHETIDRLAQIAGVHQDRLAEHERRIDEHD